MDHLCASPHDLETFITSTKGYLKEADEEGVGSSA
jgi:hypothetical protein